MRPPLLEPADPTAAWALTEIEAFAAASPPYEHRVHVIVFGTVGALRRVLGDHVSDGGVGIDYVKVAARLICLSHTPSADGDVLALNNRGDERRLFVGPASLSADELEIYQGLRLAGLDEDAAADAARASLYGIPA